MIPTKVSGCVNCDPGSGRLGDTLQQVGVAELALILLNAVFALSSIIAAIFGQCGLHGWPGFSDPWVQQSAIATAGEASRLINKKRATGLEPIFTVNTGLILYRHEPEICDLNHTRMLNGSHLVIVPHQNVRCHCGQSRDEPPSSACLRQ